MRSKANSSADNRNTDRHPLSLTECLRTTRRGPTHGKSSFVRKSNLYTKLRELHTAICYVLSEDHKDWAPARASGVFILTRETVDQRPLRTLRLVAQTPSATWLRALRGDCENPIVVVDSIFLRAAYSVVILAALSCGSSYCGINVFQRL